MSIMHGNQHSSLSADEIATHYFARERSGAMAMEEQRNLEAWLADAPANRIAYQEVRTMWSDLEELRADPVLLQLREDAIASTKRHGWRRQWTIALAASLLGIIALGGGWATYQHFNPVQPSLALSGQRYATRTGQLSSIALPDGSLAIMDTKSEIHTRIGTQGDRRVEVTHGRVLFDVAKVPGRTFTVSVGATDVVALGTRFDVYRKADEVQIDLIEGHLRIQPRGDADAASQFAIAEPVELFGGDKLRVTGRGWHLMRGGAAQAEWVRGQLLFDNQRIVDVVTELNRYSDRPLVLKDSALGERRISAVIRTDNPMMLARALEEMGIGRVQETASAFEIEAPE